MAELAEAFADRVATMRLIERGDQQYGEGSPALQATAYYLDHLLPDVAERARAASTLPQHPVEVLISLCGFAATPTVLTYELLRPRRLVVITSRDAPDSVDLIGRRLVPDRLRFQDFRHVAVDPSDPLEMYERWTTRRRSSASRNSTARWRCSGRGRSRRPAAGTTRLRTGSPCRAGRG